MNGTSRIIGVAAGLLMAGALAAPQSGAQTVTLGTNHRGAVMPGATDMARQVETAAAATRGAAGAPLTVALSDVSLGKIPHIVAIEEGLFVKHGVNVDAYITDNAARTIGASGVKPNPALVRQATEPPVINTGGGSPMIVSLTTTVQEPGRIALATTDNLVRWWVFAKPGIARLEDLKGKRLGVSGQGTCSGFIARVIAQRMKWNPDQDLSIISGGYGVDWLQQGVVDAIIADDTHYAYALSVGLKPIAHLRNWNVPIPCDSVIVTRVWLGQPGHRDLAKRFLMAVVEAIAMIKKDPTSANRAVAKWFNITDPAMLQTMYRGVEDLPAKPYPAVAGMKKVMELFDYHEMRRHRVEDFYDDSLMGEIDRSGFIDALYTK